MTRSVRCDTLVIGSGFGGSVAALRLAQSGRQVIVAEMGRRGTPEYRLKPLPSLSDLHIVRRECWILGAC